MATAGSIGEWSATSVSIQDKRLTIAAHIFLSSKSVEKPTPRMVNSFFYNFFASSFFFPVLFFEVSCVDDRTAVLVFARSTFRGTMSLYTYQAYRTCYLWKASTHAHRTPGSRNG